MTTARASGTKANARRRSIVPPITAVPIADFLQRPRPRYLIKRLLPRLGLGVIFGEPGSGKTFFALDLALHVARGKPWRGHRTARAGVIYLVAEGEGGFRDRLTAALTQIDRAEHPDIRFEIIAASVDLLRSGPHLEELVDAMRDAAERIGPIGLIVVDTLSRTMPGGNENAPEDMTAYVANVSRLADALGAFALLIHHAGKDPTRGARGHSALRAAADLEIEVARVGVGEHLATVSKSRDFSGGARYAFALRRVELGVDDDGDAITSCVVVSSELPAPRPTGSAQSKLLALLEREFRNGKRMWTSGEIRELGRTVLGMHRNTARDAVVALGAGGFLRPIGDCLELAYPPVDSAGGA